MYGATEDRTSLVGRADSRLAGAGGSGRPRVREVSQVSTQRHESHGGSCTGEASSAKGLQQNPHRVRWTICRAGWSAPIGEALFCRHPLRSRASNGSSIYWEKWSTDEVRLGHTASLLLLQGMPLLHLFDASTWFQNNQDQITGPFYLLRGSPGDIWRVPLRLTKVVLGRVFTHPAELPAEELLSALLRGAHA